MNARHDHATGPCRLSTGSYGFLGCISRALLASRLGGHGGLAQELHMDYALHRVDWIQIMISAARLAQDQRRFYSWNQPPKRPPVSLPGENLNKIAPSIDI